MIISKEKIVNWKKGWLLLFVCILAFNSAADEYIWTANGDGVSLYQEKNWEYMGQNPDKIDPGVPITYDLLVNSGTVGGGGFNGNLLLGGHRLKITGGQVVGQSNSGIMSFDPSNTTTGEIVMTGGRLSCYFARNVDVSLSNDAIVELLGATDLLQGSSVEIDPNFTGSIILKNVDSEFVRKNYLSLFSIAGAPAAENDNIFLSTKLSGTQISLQKLKDEIGIKNKDYSDTPRPNNGPNIVFIFLDDMGYGDLGSFWQNQRTGDQKMVSPVLDKLAEEGVMLKQHYCAAPVCAPSRASLLEGLHQGHSSVRNNQFDKPLKEGLGMAEMLRKAGYRTMHVGKSGLAGGRNSSLEGHPLLRGFDQYFGYLFHVQGHIHYPQDGTTGKEAYFTDGGTAILEGTMLTYTTDAFTAKSKQWIMEHQAKRPEQPFFLYLAYDVPHSALDVPTVAYPEGRGVNGGLQWTGKESETPWVNTAKGVRNAFIHADYKDKDWPLNQKKHATMMRRVDNACEDLIQTLKDLKIDENTMIVFSADNGPHNSGGQDATFFQSYAFMNGIKRDMWEGGIRMATIARYLGVIPQNTEHTFPSGHWDWMATFADLAGVAQPIYSDGVSLMPSLKQEEGQKTKGYLYHEYYQNGSTPTYADFGSNIKGRKRNEMQVIRIGNYKGIRYNVTTNADDFEIYDVINDPQESQNLASTMTALQQQMKDKTLQVRKVDASAARPYDNELIPALNISGAKPGLQKKIYNGKHLWVPNFELLNSSDSAIVTRIDTNTEGRDSLFGLFYTGYLNVELAGTYTFYLESSSSCHVKIHDIHLLDNDFAFSTEETAATLNLSKGLHPLRVYYQQNKQGETKLNLKVSGANIIKQTVPEAMLFYAQNNQVGVGEINEVDELKVFPQPANDELHITMRQGESKFVKAFVYDTSGRLIKSSTRQVHSNANRQRIVLSVSDLFPGVYILGVSDKNKGSIKYTKFVKR